MDCSCVNSLHLEKLIIDQAQVISSTIWDALCSEDGMVLVSAMSSRYETFNSTYKDRVESSMMRVPIRGSPCISLHRTIIGSGLNSQLVPLLRTCKGLKPMMLPRKRLLELSKMPMRAMCTFGVRRPRRPVLPTASAFTSCIPNCHTGAESWISAPSAVKARSRKPWCPGSRAGCTMSHNLFCLFLALLCRSDALALCLKRLLGVASSTVCT
mmetsp:Transcript_14187/g.37793  ORF Transcript_14187/g.37793 Transcript_14187/m.37793 type:complete len:212 (+) Transcript_14187:1130-1765(+)